MANVPPARDSCQFGSQPFRLTPGRGKHTANSLRLGLELNQATLGLAGDTAHFVLRWVDHRKKLPKKRGSWETGALQKNSWFGFHWDWRPHATPQNTDSGLVSAWGREEITVQAGFWLSSTPSKTTYATQEWDESMKGMF